MAKKKPTSRVSVKPPSIDRKEASLCVIAVEGKTEEPSYFKKLIEAEGAAVDTEIPHRYKKDQPACILAVLPSENEQNDPKSVINRLKEIKNVQYLLPGDSLWAVFDVDHYRDNFLKKLLNEAKSSGFQLAISNPCFEVWLHLHSNEIDELKELCAEKQDERPKSMKEWCSYSYAEVDTVKFKRHVRLATDRAKTNEAERKEVYPNCPGTDVYKVVEDILRKLESL